ncbi:EAL domain-containing protein [Pseudomonas sp. GXZC]|uniref:EAL domain-containing protein n=1 Tax=Pseudomonas sp. GXZC TaxID=3003351 RepID=UPI0022AACA8E|nr:EAL domain-containing protein [Pseudomonas sp. GXZC]WAT32148.1 EAL domain-containing protein [Pseudomonas sp. GXZC]
MNSLVSLGPTSYSMPGGGGRCGLLDFVAKAPVTNNGWSVVHLDIANFRLLNKLLGHESGDKILGVIGAALCEDGRHHWFHVAGDAWVGVSERRDPYLVEQQINQLRKTVRARVTEAVGKPIRIDAAVGLASCPDLSHAVARAESACRQAKSSGRGLIAVDSVKDDWESTDLIDRFILGGDLETIVELYRQRIQYLDGKHHFEILSRIGGESVGTAMVMIEQLGLVQEYDLMLLRMALKAIPECAPVHTVNFSSLTACDSGAMLEAISILRGRSNIAIEITETAEIQNLALVKQTVDMLASAGVAVYLDDFGEGAASLGMIDLPWKAVKLSRSICGEGAPRDVLEAVIKLAKNRGMVVIAECIETKNHMDYLTSCGVDAFQGYYIHRPEAFKFG